MPTTLESIAWPNLESRRTDADLLRRIEAEFREMPGLVLTLSQAARLFSLERPDCERMPHALVRAGRLRLSGRGFALAGSHERTHS